MSGSEDLARNRAAVAGYDATAADYAAETDHAPTADHVEALQRLAGAVGPGGLVLEVASGPGWDADRLEAMGLVVRRTDLSQGFIALQGERGRVVEPLDLITGDLGGPWDGLVALYVLQHVGRDLVDGVIRRIAAALRPGGTLLISFQEGEGEQTTLAPGRRLSGGALARGRHGRLPVATRPRRRVAVPLQRPQSRLDHGNRAPFLRFGGRPANPAPSGFAFGGPHGHRRRDRAPSGAPRPDQDP